MIKGATSATRQQRAEAVAPIFEALTEQGRMRKWLAEKIGCHYTTLQRYQYGMAQMPSEAIKKAYEALGMEPSHV
jgi:hypothetical protein